MTLNALTIRLGYNPKLPLDHLDNGPCLKGVKPMRAYMAQEKDGDRAMLVFARSTQESRKISFGTGWHMGDDWISWTAKWLRNLPSDLWKLNTGEPQVIDDPEACFCCGLWGVSNLDKQGFCTGCTEGAS